ncbi:MAG: carbohydrate ABC transporter permease [Eubacteriales bacterium]|nr:carbohydrate ABC transporter permease [Eubacteriales bacterium]
MRKAEKIRTVIGEILLAILTVIIFIPIYYFAIGAFKTRSDIVQHPLVITIEGLKKVGFKNFAYVWGRTKVVESLFNTATITFISIIVVVIFASLAGFAIARVKRKAFETFYALLVAMMVIPFIGCLIPLVKQSVAIGTYGSIWACILIQIAWNLPFATFLFVGFMGGIPKDLEEAAYIDGCSMLGTYFRIFLPLLTPVISTCCIRCGVGIWNDFLVTSTMVNQVDAPTLMVSLYKFFGSRSTEYGYAFAGIILSSIPMITVFLLLQKNFIKGLTAGAVKG